MADHEHNIDINTEFYKKLNQQIVQKDNLIRLLQMQVNNLKNSGNEPSDEKKEQLETRISEQDELIATLTDRLRELEDRKPVASSPDEAEKLKLKIQSLEKINSELMQKSDNHETEENISREMERLRDQVLELENRNNEFKKLLSDSESHAEKNSRRVIELENRLRDLNSDSLESQKLQEKISSLETLLVTLEKNSDQLEKDKRELQEKVSILEKSGEKASAEDELLSRIKDDLLLKIEKQKQLVSQQKDELDRIKREKTDEKMRIEFLEKAVSDWEEKLRKSENRYENLDLEKQKLLKTLKEKETELFELHAEKSRLLTDLEKKSEQIRDLNLKVSGFQEELQKYAELQKTIETIQAEKAGFDEEMKRLRSQIELLGNYALNIAKS